MARNAIPSTTPRSAVVVAIDDSIAFSVGFAPIPHVLTALVGSLVLLLAVFLVAKQAHRRTAGTGRRSKGDAEKTTAMPWEPLAAAKLECQHSASASSVNCGGHADSLLRVPMTILDSHAGHLAGGYYDWSFERCAQCPPFTAFAAPPIPVERHPYEDAYDYNAVE